MSWYAASTPAAFRIEAGTPDAPLILWLFLWMIPPEFFVSVGPVS